MKDQNRPRMPRFFIAGAMGLGIVLLLFGIANGNNPVISPDLNSYAEKLRQNPVSGEQLVDWNLKGKRDFRLVGFRDRADCKAQWKVIEDFQCYDIKDLDDANWVRRRFNNFSMPLVVYGDDTEQGLKAAARLTYYGYQTRVLEGGFLEFQDRFLQPEYLNVDVYELDEDQLHQLSVYRYLTGYDPLVKTPGQSWAIAMADTSGDIQEEEAAGYEEGGDDDEWEEEEWEEEEEEYEGC